MYHGEQKEPTLRSSSWSSPYYSVDPPPQGRGEQERHELRLYRERAKRRISPVAPQGADQRTCALALPPPLRVAGRLARDQRTSFHRAHPVISGYHVEVPELGCRHPAL